MCKNRNRQKAAKRVDIERLLQDGYAVQVKPEGYSMYPLFVPGRDEVVISPLQEPGKRKLKRGDVVLYRREGSILVLHRIWKVNADGFFLVGDNQSQVEGPLSYVQMRGIMTAFIRKGRYVPVTHPVYVLYSFVWLRALRFRPIVANTVHKVKGIRKGGLWGRGIR